MNSYIKKTFGILLGIGMISSTCIAFSDVQERTSFQEAISYVEAKGIVQGYKDGTYKPWNKINRYDFTKIIIASRFTLGEIESCETQKYTFPDVPRNEWFTPYVCTAKKFNVINGYQDGFFRGKNNITSPEALKIILEAYQLDIPPKGESEEWYEPYREKANELGLLANISGNPTYMITRGEMAEFIFLMDSLLPDSTKIPKKPSNPPLSKSLKTVMTTVFWAGESADDSNGFISNAESAWDEDWGKHFGGVDDPDNRCGFRPCDFIPNENAFYFALPYNDFDESGKRKASAHDIPWYEEEKNKKSVIKNRWIEVTYNGKTCYGQWEDVGPFYEDDYEYVFGNQEHKNTYGVGAGLDISPAFWDCLGLRTNSKTSWRFVDRKDVPEGPWTVRETTTDVMW